MEKFERRKEAKKKFEFDWEKVDGEFRFIYLLDKTDENVYGPYSVEMLKILYKDNRINDNFYYFVPGMESWKNLGEFPLSKIVFGDTENWISEDLYSCPLVGEIENEKNGIVARGICRDVSIGGLQLLASGLFIEKGTSLELVLKLNKNGSEEVIQVKSQVGRLLSGDQGIFLRFGNLDQEQEEFITNYLSDNN